jgi:hypothetical protein
MHEQARRFISIVKEQMSEYFHGVKVLDVGSGDINGNNQIFFHDMVEYHGNDVVDGKNVTIVNKENIEESNREKEGFYIRNGIVVVLKNAIIPDGTVI